MTTSLGAPIDPLWEPDFTADHIGTTTAQLQKWRYHGTGPKFVKVSHKVIRYRRSDVEAWIESRVRTAT